MLRSIPRRSVLTGLLVLPATLSLVGCNDSGEAKAQSADTSTGQAPAKAPEPQGSVDVAKLMQPGPLPDQVMGKADAPVMIVEYASMTCPHCAHFAAATLPALKTKYIDPGKVKLILREFPFDPRAEAGFMLARCSNDNFFPMVEVLFKQQPNWVAVRRCEIGAAADRQARRLLAGVVREMPHRPAAARPDPRRPRPRLRRNSASNSTPTFFINGKKYPGAMSIDEMSAIIDPLL